MSLSLLALKIILPSIAKRLLESFGISSKVTNTLLEQAIDTGTDEVLNSSEARKTLSQKLDPIAKQLKADIQPLFEQEAGTLELGSRNAILLGVAETLIKARLTSDTLAESNFNTEKLKRHLLKANPEAARFFSQDEEALYQQAIAKASQRLIEAAPEVEGFSLATASTALQRLGEIAGQLKTQREQAIQAADEFAIQYRRIVQDKLDRLEVFGLPRMDRLTSSQSLSMAYITLSVSGAPDADENSPLTLMGNERLERESGRKLRRIDEVICDCQRLVIRGGAGAGKSTLMQWLAVRAASQTFPQELQHWNSKIPFFIRLRSLVDRKFPSPEAFPVLIARNFAATMPPDWVHRYLNRGQAMVLIDGVDELPRQERQDFFEALKDLVRDFSKTTFIISSRPSGLKDLQGEEWQEWEDWVKRQSFVNLTLEPMSPANVEEFVTRWHSALPVDDSSSDQPDDPIQTAENLKRQLRQRAELRRLASTPLLCAMICALHRERRETLPSARLQLYWECIDMLLSRRDTGRKIPLDETYPIGLNESQKVELLQSLALKLMRLNRSDLEVDRVDSHFEAELKKTSLPEGVTGKQIRDFFVDRAGLLREPVVGQIDFAHRTFQEYLAAKAALDEDSLEELLQQIMDDQWRESIIVAAGLARPKERVKLLNFLVEQGNAKPEYRHYLHLLAVACLETATTVEPTTRELVLTAAKKLLPPKDDDEVTLVAKAGNEIVPLLKYESLYSSREACRCIKALVQIGTDAAMQNLVDYAKAEFENSQYSIGRTLGRAWNVFEQRTYLCNVLSHLRVLGLEGTKISNVSLLSTLTQLETLYLGNNQIEDLSPLSKLTQLKELHLDNNQIEDLSPLSKLTQLKELHLDNNQIEDLSPLSKLTQLKELHLDNQIEDLSPLSKLTQLKTLHLTNLNLSELPLSLAALTQLETLHLLNFNRSKELSSSHFYLREILPSLTGLTQLKTLHLESNEIEDLSPLRALTQLETLFLTNLYLSEIPPSLAALTQLKTLYLDSFQVEDLSPLSKLTQLETLFLTNLDLSEIPPFLVALTQLKTLYLSSFHVEDLSPLRALTQLETLFLTDLNLSEISPSLTVLTQLKTLHLNSNEIMDLSPLRALTQLEKLYLPNLRVIDLSPLRALTQLKELHLPKIQVIDVSPLEHLSDLTIYR